MAIVNELKVGMGLSVGMETLRKSVNANLAWRFRPKRKPKLTAIVAKRKPVYFCKH
jgi:hypothetical protein